ncbi:hypothetical protein EDD86DRAFT_243817 [Gorgonomyces haynaldii]|nr:hypothetical protein EDD86DRAFT_243817 [Gorgonomyces haynaldii]
MLLVDLPPELLLHVAVFLSVPDLKTLSLCNKLLMSVCNSNSVWKGLCLEDWKQKQFTSNDLAHRLDYYHLVDDLTTEDMHVILQQRNVITKNLDTKNLKYYLLKTTPHRSPCPLSGPKWKASYFAKRKDALRTSITMMELCSITWNFKFINGWMQDEVGTVRFIDNGEYHSSLFGDQMKWKFYRNCIQVEHYPPTKVYRTKDWGWILANRWVLYSSGDFPDNLDFLDRSFSIF